jgi:alkylation response protein AidB-like acyl-CoA dehydrogenase
VLLQLSSDQESFRDTTAKFLDSLTPPAQIRKLRDDPRGFESSYWRRGCELGWVSLLAPEAQGGGSISGEGLVDLSLIAHEFGRRAAPGPLIAANVAVDALSAPSVANYDDLVERVVSGDVLVSWVSGAAGPGRRAVGLSIYPDGAGVRVSGLARPVESADVAEFLVIAGLGDSGVTQVLVPTDHPDVSIKPLNSVDLTRRFFAVTFDDVRLGADAVLANGELAEQRVERQLQVAAVLANAEAVGAMQSGFDMTVAWAFDRYSFGRPLASYQELKHRFADMLTWLEASHAINDAAVAAVSAGSPQATELVSAAKAYIGHYGNELLQDCVQIHGGIGVTFEHDLHLFLRRTTLNAALYGTPAEHRRRIADVVEQDRRGSE